jgi:hypothetical protein
LEFEHDPIGVGFGDREVGIRQTHCAEPGRMIGMAADSGFDRLGETVGSGGTDRVEDLGLVLEIAVGRHRAAADSLGESSHRHTLVAIFRKEAGRLEAEGFSKILELVLGERGTRHGLCT